MKQSRLRRRSLPRNRAPSKFVRWFRQPFPQACKAGSSKMASSTPNPRQGLPSKQEKVPAAQAAAVRRQQETHGPFHPIAQAHTSKIHGFAMRARLEDHWICSFLLTGLFRRAAALRSRSVRRSVAGCVYPVRCQARVRPAFSRGPRFPPAFSDWAPRVSRVLSRVHLPLYAAR